ncbi:AAA family ATPase [Salibacterium sp. K-3]
MKIESLHIYGFGRFQDEQIDVDSSFHVFQGRNETGKSTIRAFIQAVLFGFPSKKEQALRYEPKEGSRYGGRLTIQLDNGTTAVVERTGGKKSAGDVKVFTDDGKQHGEEWLQALLGGLDRSMFQGIFCFGLEGLGEIKQLKGNDLNQYIYEAGMTGTRHIAGIEKKLQHQLDQLYKPKGQKPAINMLVQELHEKKKELQEWESRFDTYDRLIRKKEELTNKQSDLKNRQISLQAEKEEQQRRQSLLSIYRDIQDVHDHLHTLASADQVSLEWEEQWTAHNERRKEAQAQEEEQALAEKQAADRNRGTAVNWRILSFRDTVYDLKEKLSVYQKFKEDRSRLQQEAAQKKKSMEEKGRRLGDVDEKEAAKARPSISAEEELRDLSERGRTLQERIHLLNEQVQQYEDRLAFLKKETETLKQNRRSTEEKQRSAEAAARQEKEQSEKHRQPVWKQPVLLLQLAAVVFFTLGTWEMMTGHWLMGLIMFGAGLSSASLWILQHQLRTMTRRDPLDSTEREQHKAELEADQRLEISIREKEWEYDREYNMYQSSMEKKNEAEAAWQELQKKLEEWARTYDVPLPPSILYAFSFFTTIQEWQEEKRDLENMEQEILTTEQKMKEVDEETAAVAGAFGLAGDQTDTVIRTAAAMVEKEEAGHYEIKQEIQDWETVRSRKQYYRKKKENAEQAVQELYRLSGVKTAEAFHQALAAKKEYNEWKAKEEWLISRMHRSLAEGETTAGWFETFEQTHTDPGQDIQNIEQEEQEVKAEEEEYVNKLAALNQEIRTIEEGGTYEQILQQFEEKKLELNRLVRTWKTYKTAQTILDRAKSVYEKERQPEVIRHASSCFSYVTASRYERLFAPIGEETFIVEDNRGFRFTPEELSRGTAEQLYLSLRLALAESYHHNEVLPFIMDDPFVNFDRERKSMVYSLLTSISPHRQILYFTCEDTPSLPSGEKPFTRTVL